MEQRAEQWDFAYPSLVFFFGAEQIVGEWRVFYPLGPQERQVMRWLAEQQPKKFAALNDVWINTIQPPRLPERLPPPREYVMLEEVRHLLGVSVPEGDLALWRDKAAGAFLFLSGMRATAFCTMPLKCVNIDERRVRQLPTEGVRTKNKRAAITARLAIDELLDAAKAWDNFVRERLPETAPWYAVVLAPFGEQSLVPNAPGTYRVSKLNVRLRHLFQLADLRYKSAHLEYAGPRYPSSRVSLPSRRPGSSRAVLSRGSRPPNGRHCRPRV